MTRLAAFTDLQRERAAGISFLRRRGAGAPIVFLHGIGSDASSWTPLTQTLDAEFEAILWNAPGYADSVPVAGSSPHPNDYASALAAMLDALGLRRVALVGHSLGSLFAGRFAATYPERVSALALLSPALGYRVSAGGPLPAQVQARIDNLERLGAPAYAARSAPRLIYRPETKPDLVARVEAAMAVVRPGGYAQAVRALGAGDLVGDAATIAAPTLVAVGAQDVVTPPENAQRLRDGLRRAAPLSVVPDSGHALPQEAPAFVADLLSTFIRTSANV